MSAPRRIVVLAAVLLAAVFALTACAATKAEVAEQNKQQCFAYEKQITMAMNLVHADSGIYPNIQDVVKELGAKCPSGGTYSFDTTTDVVTCSIHGHP